MITIATVNLTAYERETIINFSEEDNVCTIYTCSRPQMTKLDRLCKSNPDTYKLVAETEISKTYETKKNLISYRTPKQSKEISEERKEQLRENAKRMQLARKQKG